MKRYLAIPGCLLLIIAFVRATVTFEWDALNVGILAAGAAVLGGAAIWNREEVAAWFRDPRGVFAVTTGVSVAVFVALIVMANIAVWYNPWSVDMTASGRNQVSEETRVLLRRLETPVALRQFGRQVADPRIEQLLRSFARETPRVSVEFVDADRQRDLAAAYNIVTAGTVIVEAGETFRKVEDVNEQALITAVLQVTNPEPRTICFAGGHGERALADTGPTGLSELNATLEASNYRTQSILLLEGEVPEECETLVIAGPRQDLEPIELERLTDYASRGGRIAVLLEPNPAPSLDGWLRPRGLAGGRGTVIDSGAGRQVGGGPRTAPVASYADHPITRDFNYVAIFEGARPIEVIEMPELGGRPGPVARSGGRAFSTESTDPEPAFTEGRDIRGPLTLAAATTQRAGRRPEDEVRLVAFGDSDFISNAMLRRSGNRDLFLRTVAWLLGEQEATIVAVAPRENRRLDLSEQMRAWMYVVNLGLLPLIPLTAGILVYLRSRR